MHVEGYRSRIFVKTDRIIRELRGDLPDELIATGLWLDVLAAERKLKRRGVETDESLRERVLVARLNEQIATSIVSLLQLDRRYST